MSGSRSREEVTNMTKARLMFLLVFAALIAYNALGLLKGFKPFGMNDGGWID